MSSPDMEKSTVVAAVKKKGEPTRYFRIAIPVAVAEELGLREGDILAWEVVEHGGRRVALIRKLE